MCSLIIPIPLSLNVTASDKMKIAVIESIEIASPEVIRRDVQTNLQSYITYYKKSLLHRT